MEILEKLNNKIDSVIHEYDKLRLENIALKQELEELKSENDELVRNNHIRRSINVQRNILPNAD